MSNDRKKGTVNINVSFSSILILIYSSGCIPPCVTLALRMRDQQYTELRKVHREGIIKIEGLKLTSI